MSQEAAAVPIVPGSGSGEAADALKSAKETKTVYCETCHFSLNSEAQATVHYNGKGHLRRLKQLKFSTPGAVAPFRPYKPRMTLPNKWTTPGAQMNRPLLQQTNTCFNPTNMNTQYTSSNLLHCQYQNVPSQGYSFGFQQTISTVSSGSYQQFSTCYGPYGQPMDHKPNEVITPLAHSNVNPVAKAVLDNFLGVLPTKRRKIVHCDVCDLTFNSESQATAHFQGLKHQKRAKIGNGEVVTSLPEEAKELKTLVAPKSLSSLLWCDTCRIYVNSQKQLEAHNLGQSHKNKLNMIDFGKTEDRPWTEMAGRKSGWFFCSTCNISVPTTVALSQHVLSASHISNKKSEES